MSQEWWGGLQFPTLAQSPRSHLVSLNAISLMVTPKVYISFQMTYLNARRYICNFLFSISSWSKRQFKLTMFQPELNLLPPFKLDYLTFPMPINGFQLLGPVKKTVICPHDSKSRLNCNFLCNFLPILGVWPLNTQSEVSILALVR